jgi:hypothetical protein
MEKRGKYTIIHNDKQADCIICTAPILGLLKNVQFLWEDSNYSGYPICTECAAEIKDRSPHPEQLIDPLIRKRANQKPIKKGLDIWL